MKGPGLIGPSRGTLGRLYLSFSLSLEWQPSCIGGNLMKGQAPHCTLTVPYTALERLAPSPRRTLES